MKPDEQVISKYDLEKFNNGEPNTRVHEIWNNIVSTMPENLKLEAQTKGFTLKKMEEEYMGLVDYEILVNNPSEELNNELLKHHLFIICITD